MQGRWASAGPNQQDIAGEFTIATANGTTTLTTKNDRVTIVRVERSRSNPGLSWYKITVQDARGRSGFLYGLQISASRILMSEEVRAPLAGLNRLTPSTGILYPITRIDRSREFTPITTKQLPASLDEIWQGGSSNRFVNIRLDNTYIYYAVGNPEQESIFPIADAYRRGNNTYKLVSNQRAGARVIFLRNVTQDGFEFSVCENVYRTAAEVQALDESFCDQFNTMRHYYQKNDQRIYVPENAVNYVAGELRKINNYVSVDGQVILRPYFIDSIRVYINTKNRSGENLGNRFSQIQRNSPLRSLVNAKWVPLQFDGNMFDRDYIVISTKARTIEPDCNTTYTSMDEVKKLSSPLLVCRLNLSALRLTELPKEIYEYTNLQYLNLGETTIPDAALNDLRRRLAKLDLRYSRPPRTDTEVELLSIVIRSNQFTDESEKMVRDIAGNLASDRNKKIRIEGDFYDDKQRKLLSTAIKNTTDLLYKNKVNRQYGQVSEKLNDRRKEQTTAAGPTLRIIGINYAGPGLNSPPKTN